MKAKKFLPLNEALAFAESAAAACFDEETGEYMPQVKEFAIRAEALARCGGLTLPEDVGERYAFVFQNREAKRVLRRIDRKQFAALRAAVDEKLQFKLALFASGAARKTAELLETVAGLAASFEELFGTLEKSDVSAFVKSVGAMEKLDENRLARAVFEAREKNGG
jgi:hypothetical protein